MDNKRLFNEIWGSLKLENLGYKILAGAMFLVALSALALSYYVYSINRVPLVIRVNEAGKAQVLKMTAFKHPAGKGEIYYFAKSFLREMVGFNSFTVRTQIARALNKMSPSYAKYINLTIKRTKYIKNAVAADVQFQLTIKKLEIRNQTKHHIVLRAILTVNIIANQTSKIEQTENYMDRIILKRIKRSVNFPFGLEVVNFTETKL
jgi:hypothetical protein